MSHPKFGCLKSNIRLSNLFSAGALISPHTPAEHAAQYSPHYFGACCNARLCYYYIFQLIVWYHECKADLLLPLPFQQHRHRRQFRAAFGMFIIFSINTENLEHNSAVFSCIFSQLSRIPFPILLPCTVTANMPVQDACFGCNDHTSRDQLSMMHSGEPGMSPRTRRFARRDQACWQFLKQHQLEDTNLPEAHVLTLYRYMDISSCHLCNSICETLDTRNRHWIGEGFFDPLLHNTRCRPKDQSSKCCSIDDSRTLSFLHQVYLSSNPLKI